MNDVRIYTDGSCLKNKDGGWGAVLVNVASKHRKEISGFEANTTNNRMELMAVVKGLEALLEPCDVVVTSDSKYVVDSFKLGWVLKWMNQGWRTSSGSQALNQDLIKRIIELCMIHNVRFEWVRGHNGHTENTLADRLATNASRDKKGTVYEY